MEAVELYESGYELFEERSTVGFLQISAKVAVTVKQIINNTSIQRRVSLTILFWAGMINKYHQTVWIKKVSEISHWCIAWCLTLGKPAVLRTFKLSTGSLYVLKISAPASSGEACQEAQQPSWWDARRLLVLPSVFDQTAVHFHFDECTFPERNHFIRKILTHVNE